MPQPIGRRLPLSLPRRFVCDLVHFASRVPLCTSQRVMRLQSVADARTAARPRPGWCTVFARAYALVCARRPVLRRAYIPWPWPHLYEHPETVASVAVERDHEGEEAVLFVHLRAPENQSLAALEDHFRRFKEAPLDEIALYRRALKTSRLPQWVRRLVWWYGLEFDGYRRARHLGTFGLSVTSGLGASSVHLLTPVTTALNYGVLGEDGSLDVRLTYDHRVLDGCTAARTLDDLEAVLAGEVLAELRSLAGAKAAG